MLSMDNGQMEIIATEQVIEEEGEILEDGEIDEEDAVEVEEEEVVEVEEDEPKEDDDASDEDDEKKKHHRKSHHKRRKRKHDKEDKKLEEKKSRHKKRKGDEVSEEGGNSPPSKKKKKRKKHSKDKKERESASPEADTYEEQATVGSESPPLPSEQGYYDTYETVGKYSKTYTDYNQSTTDYNQSTEYNSKTTRSAYGYDNAESYQHEEGFSSGSDSCYSDFESHLAQYQNYKKSSMQEKPSHNDGGNYDEDSYYSVGYDDNLRRQRRTRDSSSRSHRSQRHRNGGNSSYEDKRRSHRSRSRRVAESPSNADLPVCKYFREGHCGKGDKCNYSHRISPRRVRETKPKKHPELCQFYMTGSCSNGDKCTYMHEDYPCKYFHTGTKCLAGEKCMFSHEPLTDLTKPIVQKWQDMYNSIDDSEEIEALEKAGLRPLQKPPPGMGLLPTPTIKLTPQQPPNNMGTPMQNMPRMGAIPSLFDIKVEPSPELQKRIDQNAVPSLTMTDDELIAYHTRQNAPFAPNQGGLLPLPTPNMPRPVAPYYSPGPSLLGMPPVQMQSPTTTMHGQPNPQAVGQQQAQGWNNTQNYDQFYNQSDENNTNDMMQTDQALTKDHADHHNHEHGDDYHMQSSHEDDAEEDVIRMDDHDVIKDEVKAPSFLPAKQKALFMRIHQKRKTSNGTSNEDSLMDGSGKENATDSWTYSSEEDDSSSASKGNISAVRRPPASNSVQSIMQMISNKKSTDVDTNLLSKVASVISMSPASKPDHTPSHAHTHEPMMSPPRNPPHHRERKTSSGSNSSPGHPSTKQPYHPPQSLRRRLSTSELYKEPLVIPLVAKQSADSMHASHPDPRISLSRLFGQKRVEFKGPIPPFGKDLVMVSGKLVGLKITLSSEGGRANAAEKRSDPRLLTQQTRTKQPAAADPRVKSKPNDPRLGRRASAAMRSPPSQHTVPVPVPKPLIPQKPAALLTKPPSSVIPSLPELNLDLAHVSEANKITSPTSKAGDSISSLPKLLRAKPKASALHKPTPPPEAAASEATTAPSIAPYDPRFITSGSTNTTVTPTPAPYDPRAMTSTAPASRPSAPVSVPPLFDPRNTNADVKKRTIQLPKLTPAPPKLTPAPGYMPKKIPELKMGDTNGNSPDLPTGEQQDF